jgi:hypothetical protein
MTVLNPRHGSPGGDTGGGRASAEQAERGEPNAR